jgi:3-deoxy-manno-octulosonate cytidylyltransferase (CMP-KDO synthetase)
MSNSLILIPARYGSTRFPGKPLAKINDMPMIQYVIQNCKATGFDYAVVTDNDEIEDFIISLGEKVVRVNDDVPTGSERIALAYTRFFSQKDYKLIINVQGDEPLLKPETIKKIASSHESKDVDIFTGINERSSSEEDFKNPNIVKCVYARETKSCLYFSRASLPFSSGETSYTWYQHIGIYSYKPQALLDFVELPMSRHETLEKLEQLRALDNGLSIGAEIINVTLIGVDSIEDIERVEEEFMKVANGERE